MGVLATVLSSYSTLASQVPHWCTCLSLLPCWEGSMLAHSCCHSWEHGAPPLPSPR